MVRVGIRVGSTVTPTPASRSFTHDGCCPRWYDGFNCFVSICSCWMVVVLDVPFSSFSAAMVPVWFSTISPQLYFLSCCRMKPLFRFFSLGLQIVWRAGFHLFWLPCSWRFTAWPNDRAVLAFVSTAFSSWPQTYRLSMRHWNGYWWWCWMQGEGNASLKEHTLPSSNWRVFSNGLDKAMVTGIWCRHRCLAPRHSISVFALRVQHIILLFNY